MALEDFLGKTPEIKIIDFLIENMDIDYNQIEISKFTGLSKIIVNEKISQLIYNGIVEIKEELGMFETYKLTNNEITKYLICVSLAHSFNYIAGR